jgi:hypothetical protein
MDSKPEFCEPYAKAKSARLPFPQKSDTRATKYGESVHWNLWGPASVRSLSGNYYVASHTSKFSNTFCCTSHEGEVYFKKQSFTSTFSTFSESQVWE